MTSFADGGGFRPIAVTRRSGYDESVHHGAVVGLDSAGHVALAVGDPDVAIYPRSANKPLQATAMVAAGLRLEPELLAVVCASHDGRPQHLAAVRRILAAAGLGDDALHNTAGFPLDADAATAIVCGGGVPTAMHMNCSGKHAGMVATCVINGWPLASYLDQDHPLQLAILVALAAAAGADVAHVGIDGCGAPAHVLPLSGLARAMRAIATGGLGSAGDDVYRAMTDHPVMVGGPTRDVTLLMQHIPGVLAKDGAEGVYIAALADGRAVALKVADGTHRARAPVMLAALASLGVDIGAVPLQLVQPPVLGHGRPVGEIRALIGP